MNSVVPIPGAAKAIREFAAGKRTADTRWCDWCIPLHFGGTSDPFQPCEKDYRCTMNALEAFAQTQYPFVFSTKGALVAEPEYLAVIRECNCVAQVSMVSPKFDRIEPGAPTFEQRLVMLKKLKPNVKKLVIRIQPVMLEVVGTLKRDIPRMAEVGADAIIVEGLKLDKKFAGSVKLGSDFAYKADELKAAFEQIKERAHDAGMEFYSGENRLRFMGDSLNCCGIDGVAGFAGNSYNLCHRYNGIKAEPTEGMKQPKTANCFSAIFQSEAARSKIGDFKNACFAQVMEHKELKKLTEKQLKIC
jgi:DNA repair photolyase